MPEEVARFRDSFEKHTYDDLQHFAELKNTLQVLESELAEVKRIGLDTHEQAVKTNGSVGNLQRSREQAMGGVKVAIPSLTLLIAAMGWLTVDYLNHRDYVPTDKIQAAVDSAFKENLAR